MTMRKALYWLQDLKNDDVGFIANVFFTNSRCSHHRAKLIQAMVTLIRAGHELSSASFTMPYDGLCVDGSFVSLDKFLTMAVFQDAENRSALEVA